MQNSTMNPPLRVLHLEDNPNYSALVHAKLAAEGFNPEVVCVETGEAFAAALDNQTFDLIIADYFLPTYDGIKALKLAREKSPDTPILLVSGTIGEDAAIESLKAGATDYVLKHWPERLIPAVRRALQGVEERRNRLLAENTLVRWEKLFRALSDNALDIVTILDQAGIFTYNSLSITRMLGYDPEKLKGQNAFSFIHPEDVQKAQEALQKAVAQPELAVTVQFRFQHKDGSWRHLESIGRSLLHDPEIAGVVVNSRDITEGRRAENYNAVLSKLGSQLSSASTAEEAGKVILEAADNLFRWDACTLNLYSPEEDKIFPVLTIDTIQGQKLDISSAAIGKTPTTRSRRVMNQGAELILREEPLSLSPDGMAIGDKARPSASLMFVPVRNRTRVIGILSLQSYQLKAYTQQDLDTLQTLADYCGGALERIRVERALRESERRFRHLFAGSPDAIFVEDADGLILDANPAAGRLHGLPHEQLIGRNALDLIPPDKKDHARYLFEKLVQDELRQIEGVSLTVDGREVPVEIRTSRIDYAEKRALLLHVRDISERRKAEEALRGSEIRFHSVWENSVDGMRLTDENGTIVVVNEAFCRLAGMSREELEGKLFTLTHAEGDELETRLTSYRQRFQERAIDRRIERRMTFRSGKCLDLEIANSFVELHGQRPLLLGLFRDITEQKRLEEQLRQSQKMDAIGQLAGGVAHDFNNILTVIQGHASLLRSYGELTPQAAQSAEQISQASERAAGLTRQLLTFSRRQMMQPKQLDFNVVVSNMTRMLGRILGEDIALQFNYSPNLPLVHADVGMVEQVLLNLAVNSRDAMPLGGRLAIRISVLEVGTGDLIKHPAGGAGRFVCLSMIDTGCGIEPENLPHIFEPFFTTKEVGRGTGLGLATVYGILKQHQGWVEVESELNVGTTFHVFFPGSEEIAGAAEETAVQPAVPGGTETILVVEDEHPVRDLVCKILKAYGYRVLEATTGTTALEVWREHRETVDLLLTDIVMPDGMTGRDLAEKVQADKPGLKAIFTSGYSADIVGKDFILQEGLNFLQKPYPPQKLASAIRKCLDED